jgi:hypothetical protein
VPGWYPDPAGAAGRFRFWDGHSWSATTTTRPTDQPPSSSGRPPGRRSRTPWVVAVLVLALLIAGGVFLVRTLRGPDATLDSGPSSTVSGWDDSSPTGTPPAESPPPTPSAASTPPSPLTACPTGKPDQSETQAADGRIHGGGLSFPARSDWNQSILKRGLSWAYGVDGQDKPIETNWYAMLAAGGLRRADGFKEPRQAAEGVMQCSATSDFYVGFTGRRDLASSAITVGGHPGWAITSEIRVSSSVTKLPGDVVEVVVVDLGSPDSLAMFWGAVPISDAALGTVLKQTVSALQVD